MSAEIKELQSVVQRTQNEIQVLTKNFDTFIDQMKRTPAQGHPKASDVFGQPWARNGEDPLTSRGFSFMKMIGLITGATPREEAKVELDIHDRLHNCLAREPGQEAYEYRGGGITGVQRFMAPLASSYLHDRFVNRSFRSEMKSLVAAGTDGADYDQMKWIRNKQLQGAGYSTKALSWLNELSGGALVAPPEMGELIELLRNKEALVNAGVRTVPLPPQGRLKFPRQTSPSTTYWVGENAPITESQVGTGEVTLQAKKLAVLIKAPNELIRFASPAAEALLRDDMTKSLALGLDLACLEGNGGDNRPRGILNTPGINVITSTDVRVDGDRLVANDIYRFIAAVEESNAEFEGFIMRPKTLYKYFQLRADSVSQGDKAGPFLFNLIREAGDMIKPKLAGHDVTLSTQVSQVQSKGSSTNLTYILGGMWSDALLGMFGAIEFAATTLGDTPFINDQTWVRGILSADFNVRHAAAFVLMNSLDVVS